MYMNGFTTDTTDIIIYNNKLMTGNVILTITKVIKTNIYIYISYA